MAKRKAQPRGGGFQQFVRDYTRGVSAADLSKTIDQDLARAYRVLTRDQGKLDETAGGPKRMFARLRLFFLGLSYKLTPARRLVFAIGVIAAVVGLLGIKFAVNRQGTHISVESSPLFFTVSFLALLYLLATELTERVLVRDELQVARQLQSELLPRAAPEVPGWQFAHSYRTANEVGGDYYNFRLLEDGRLAVMMGDASGHGMAAGLLMATAHATLQTVLDVESEPERVIALLNRNLCRTGDRRAFVTLFYGVLDPATGEMHYTCCGHPFPFLLRAEGAIEELGQGGMPLGIRQAIAARADRVRIACGDRLLLYTDGLPEAVSPRDEAFGFARLRELLAAGGSAGEIHARVLAAFDRHVGPGELHDDLTLLVVARQPAET
jgi:sigma-B regulation protein RsbU (phosphoserine phosphatase)